MRRVFRVYDLFLLLGCFFVLLVAGCLLGLQVWFYLLAACLCCLFLSCVVGAVTAFSGRCRD